MSTKRKRTSEDADDTTTPTHFDLSTDENSNIPADPNSGLLQEKRKRDSEATDMAIARSLQERESQRQCVRYNRPSSDYGTVAQVESLQLETFEHDKNTETPLVQHKSVEVLSRVTKICAIPNTDEMCPICMSIISSPEEATLVAMQMTCCHTLYCYDCLMKALYTSKNMRCPACNKDHL